MNCGQNDGWIVIRTANSEHNTELTLSLKIVGFIYWIGDINKFEKLLVNLLTHY